MPFGLHSAPATFQRLLDKVLGPDLEPRVLVYLDDIIVASSTFEEHLNLLREVFHRLRVAKLRLNPDKCNFCRDRLKYLGHVIDRAGIRTDPDKVKAITGWPIPTTIRKVRQFLGVASWYRRFTCELLNPSRPTYETNKEERPVGMGPSGTTSISGTEDRVNYRTRPSVPRLSAIIHIADRRQLPRARSHAHANPRRGRESHSQAERNYSATELECLAVVWGIRRMRDYLEG